MVGNNMLQDGHMDIQDKRKPCKQNNNLGKEAM